MDGSIDYSGVAAVLSLCVASIVTGFFGFYASTKAAAYDRTEKALDRNNAQSAEDFARAVNSRHDIIFAVRLVIGTIMASGLLFYFYAKQDRISGALGLLIAFLIFISVIMLPAARAFRNTHSLMPYASRIPFPSSEEFSNWWKEEKSLFGGVGILFGAWSVFQILLGIFGLISLIPLFDIPSPFVMTILQILQKG